MTALQFLRRTVGDWSSERRYLFAPKFKPVNMTTEFKFDDDGDPNGPRHLYMKQARPYPGRGGAPAR